MPGKKLKNRCFQKKWYPKMDGEVYNGKTLLKMDDLGLKPHDFRKTSKSSPKEWWWFLKIVMNPMGFESEKK